MATKLSKKEIKEIERLKARKLKKEQYENKEWYTIRSLLGNQWAN